MATTVKGAFIGYKTNLEITDPQENLISGRRKAVVAALAMSLTLHAEESKLIGSYDRHTMTRYLREGDVDVMVILNYGKHKSWYDNNDAVGCLDTYKRILDKAFPNITTRRDRNCITMQYDEFRLDVVPAYKEKSGYYQIPDTIQSKFLDTNPFKFAEKVTAVNTTMAGDYVPLIKMIKGWNREVGWPISSFHLECMMLKRYSEYKQTFTYWTMVRTFFSVLPDLLAANCYDPIKGERVDKYLDVGSTRTRQSAIQKAKTAKTKSQRAVELQEAGKERAAVEEWKGLLGNFFPSYG